VTKSELVRLARDGDRDAFDILLTDVIDHLYRIARLILRDYDSAEDAVQEALVRCWRDLPGLRDPDRFDAWLNRLLLHSVTDEARHRRRYAANVKVLRLEPAQPDAAGALADRDQLARVFDPAIDRTSNSRRPSPLPRIDRGRCGHDDRDPGRHGQYVSQTWAEHVDIVERLAGLADALVPTRGPKVRPPQFKAMAGSGSVTARVAERVATLADDARVRAYEILDDRPKAVAIMERRLLAN
jgi:DNA-directed RNA polymerase specialized sigma24 family protein